MGFGLAKKHEFLEKLKTEMGEVQWQQMGHSERLRYVSAKFHIKALREVEPDKLILDSRKLFSEIKKKHAFKLASLVVHLGPGGTESRKLEFTTANTGPSSHDRATGEPANKHEQIIFNLESGTEYVRVMRHASLVPIDLFKNGKVARQRKTGGEEYNEALDLTVEQMNKVEDEAGKPWVYALLTSNFANMDSQKDAHLLMHDAMWKRVTTEHPRPSILFNVGVNRFRKVPDALTSKSNRTAMLEMIQLLRDKDLLQDKPSTDKYKAALGKRVHLMKLLRRGETSVNSGIYRDNSTNPSRELTFHKLINEIEEQEKILIDEEKKQWKANKERMKCLDSDVFDMMDLYFTSNHIKKAFKFNTLLHRVTKKVDGHLTVSCKSGNDRTKKLIRMILNLLRRQKGVEQITGSELCTLFDTGDFDKGTPGHGNEAGHKLKKGLSRLSNCFAWREFKGASKKRDVDIAQRLLATHSVGSRSEVHPDMAVDPNVIRKLWGVKRC